MKPSKNYRIVTDGKTTYRLHRRFKTPDGLIEIAYIGDKKVYNINGELLNKHMSIQEIEPQNNVKFLTRNINTILNSGYYHAHKNM